jgi:5'-3' exonuclease
VGWDRRRHLLLDEAGVVAKFGVRPPSIPDWLGLVGDAADGFPGLPGWGAKSAAAVLAKYAHLEAIPVDPHTWGLSASRAARLAESLTQHKAAALLFRQLATLRAEVPLQETLADLEWQGAYERLNEVCHRLGDDKFPGRVPRWRTS